MCNLVFKFNLNDSMNSGKRLFLLDAYALILEDIMLLSKTLELIQKEWTPQQLWVLLTLF